MGTWTQSIAITLALIGSSGGDAQSPPATLVASPTLRCTLGAPTRIGETTHSPPDVALDAATASVAYRAGDALTRVLRRDAHPFDREVATPAGFRPRALFAMEARTILVSDGLCPDVPRSHAAKCLHFLMLGASGEPVGQALFDRVGEWPGNIERAGNVLFHVHDGVYQRDTVTRYEVRSDGVARAGQPIGLNERVDSGQLRVAFDGERWAGIYTEHRTLYRSFSPWIHLPRPARGAQELALSSEGIALAIVRGQRCEHMTLDAQTGAPRGPAVASAAIGEMPRALAARVGTRLVLRRRQLWAELRDACGRSITEVDVGDVGLGDRNRLRAQAGYQGSTMHVVYAARRGQSWSVELRSGTCGDPPPARAQ